MLYLNFSIYNPFRSKYEVKHFFYWSKRVTLNRTFEIQFSKFERFKLFELELDTRFRGRDHQGPSLTINVYGYDFSLNLHDNRHWDNDENDWIKIKYL